MTEQTQTFEPWTWTWTAGAMRGRSHVIRTPNCILQPPPDHTAKSAAPIMSIRHTPRGLLLQCRNNEIVVNGVSGFHHLLIDGDSIEHSTFAARVSIPQFKRLDEAAISSIQDSESCPLGSDLKEPECHLDRSQKASHADPAHSDRAEELSQKLTASYEKFLEFSDQVIRRESQDGDTPIRQLKTMEDEIAQLDRNIEHLRGNASPQLTGNERTESEQLPEDECRQEPSGAGTLLEPLLELQIQRDGFAGSNAVEPTRDLPPNQTSEEAEPTPEEITSSDASPADTSSEVNEFAELNAASMAKPASSEFYPDENDQTICESDPSSSIAPSNALASDTSHAATSDGQPDSKPNQPEQKSDRGPSLKSILARLDSDSVDTIDLDALNKNAKRITDTELLSCDSYATESRPRPAPLAADTPASHSESASAGSRSQVQAVQAPKPQTPSPALQVNDAEFLNSKHEPPNFLTGSDEASKAHTRIHLQDSDSDALKCIRSKLDQVFSKTRSASNLHHESTTIVPEPGTTDQNLNQMPDAPEPLEEESVNEGNMISYHEQDESSSDTGSADAHDSYCHAASDLEREPVEGLACDDGIPSNPDPAEITGPESIQVDEPTTEEPTSEFDNFLAKLKYSDEESISFADAFEAVERPTSTAKSNPNLSHDGEQKTKSAMPDENLSSGESVMTSPSGKNPEDSQLSTAHLFQQLAEEDESSPAPLDARAEASMEETLSDVHAGDVHGDDVNDYMNRLFKRLRGSDVDYKAPVAEKQEAPKAVEAKAEKPRPKAIEPRQEPMKAEDYLPKKRAPEQRANMDALRKLANDSTRMALDSHSKRRAKTVKTTRLATMVAGIAFSVMFLFMSKQLGDLSSIASGAGFVAVVGMIVHHLIACAKDRKNEDVDNG